MGIKGKDTAKESIALPGIATTKLPYTNSYYTAIKRLKRTQEMGNQ